MEEQSDREALRAASRKPTLRSMIAIGTKLRIQDVYDVAVPRTPVRLSEEGASAMRRARAVVESFLEEGAGATYGINTGFGALAEVRIPNEQLALLQRNLVLSHAVGVGQPLDIPTSRAMMLLRAQCLSLGYSGARPVVVETLVEMLNRGVHPKIPRKGSVGASGDLAPLAHLALVLLGEGEAEFEGEWLSGAEAMSRAEIPVLTLGAKEGLALINGTQGMLAFGCLAQIEAERLVATADVTGAMSLEALKGSAGPFADAVVQARPHPGAIKSAQRLRSLLSDSAIMASHAECSEVQDAYSLRCMPQVHGAAADMLAYVRGVLTIEINAATDNPLVLPDGRLQSGGNFHGQPVAAACDAGAIAMADLQSIAERRIAQLIDPALNRGLPPFLIAKPGLNSGFMMAQVSAAALVSESKQLATPNSVDTIPTSADREDHVSMGMIAARNYAMVTAHARHVLAIEALAAAQGIWLRQLEPGKGVAGALACLRAKVPPLIEDRELHRDFAAARAILTDGSLLAAATKDVAE